MVQCYESAWLSFQLYLASTGSLIMSEAVVLDFTFFVFHKEGIASANIFAYLSALKDPQKHWFGIMVIQRMLDLQQRGSSTAICLHVLSSQIGTYTGFWPGYSHQSLVKLLPCSCSFVASSPWRLWHQHRL